MVTTARSTAAAPSLATSAPPAAWAPESAQGPSCAEVTLPDSARIALPPSTDARSVRGFDSELEKMRAQIARTTCPGGLLAGLPGPLELSAVKLGTHEVTLTYGDARWPLRLPTLRPDGEFAVGDEYAQHLQQVVRLHALAEWLEAHPEVAVMSSRSQFDNTQQRFVQRSRVSAAGRTVVCLSPRDAPVDGACIATPRVERHVWSGTDPGSLVMGPVDAHGRSESFAIDLDARSACRGEPVHARLAVERLGPFWSYWTRVDAALPAGFERTRCTAVPVPLEPAPEWLGAVADAHVYPVSMGGEAQAVALLLSLETTGDLEVSSDVLCVREQGWRCGGIVLGSDPYNPVSIYAVWRVPADDRPLWYVAYDMFGGNSSADITVEDTASLIAPTLDGHTWSVDDAIDLGSGARTRSPEPPQWMHSRRYFAPSVLGEGQVELVRREAELTIWQPRPGPARDWQVTRRRREPAPKHRCCIHVGDGWSCRDEPCALSGDELRVDAHPSSVEARAPNGGSPRL